MNRKPYAVAVSCPFNGRTEEVYFFEIELQGQAYLRFNGCDNEWHKCEACEECRRKAYEKLSEASQ